MPLLTLNLNCENVKYPARKHFEKTNIYPTNNIPGHMYSFSSNSLSNCLIGTGVRFGNLNDLKYISRWDEICVWNVWYKSHTAKSFFCMTSFQCLWYLICRKLYSHPICHICACYWCLIYFQVSGLAFENIIIQLITLRQLKYSYLSNFHHQPGDFFRTICCSTTS